MFGSCTTRSRTWCWQTKCGWRGLQIKVWLLRRGRPSCWQCLLAVPAGSDYTSDLHPDWAVLKHTRDALDAAIGQWLADIPAEFLTSTMRYADTKGVKRAQPAWQAMTHFFNHQTHHRVQMTTLLTQAGVDVGMTDLIALVQT